MLSVSTLLLLPFLLAVKAENDWNVPCLSGECEYTLPSGSQSASGTLKIWGAPQALSDITGAAGWAILGCKKDALAQDIRLVCQGESAGCANLYENGGATGKVVRLPEDCGSSAFARVAQAWIPEDQTVPSALLPTIVKRDGTQPEVKALRLDTKFDQIDASKLGTVNFALKAANIPGVSTDMKLAGLKSRFFKRQFIEDAIGAIADLNDFNVDQTQELPPISIDEQFNLFNTSLNNCGAPAAVAVDIGAKADANIAIGVAAQGTIVPPSFDGFSVITSVSAELQGTIDLSANLSGELDSGKITLFEVGIPGLSFPGILEVGPSFQINAQAIASLDVNAELSVGVNYKVQNAEIAFPPQAQVNNNAVTIADTPLTLSVSPGVKAVGTVEAHLIPTLNLGLSALADVVSANVFLELDASATLRLTLEAKDIAAREMMELPAAPATHSAPVPSHMKVSQEKAQRKSHRAPRVTKTRNRANAHETTADRAPHKTSAAAHGAPTNATPPPKPDAGGIIAIQDPELAFGGCFEILAGFAINVGADASFFGLFDQETSATLFEKNFEIFKTCFGEAPPARRFFSLRASRLEKKAILRRQDQALECPAAGLGAPLGLIAEQIRAAAIKVLP